VVRTLRCRYARRNLRGTDLPQRLLLLWLFQVFRLEYLHDLLPQYRHIIGGCCPHNVPLHRKVCMDGNIAERDTIAPFYLAVRVAKCLRKA
jgi:hypothetical protein